MNEYDNIIKVIDQYELISFDIFDTLLLRNVQKPIDIFKILELYVMDKFNISEFQQKRIKAEQASRVEENNYETSLDEIYDKLSIKEKNIREEIKQKELELEEKFLIPNPFMQKVFNYCISRHKKVICITDMYLPLEFLQKILKKNGYGDVKIYLSCYYHKHKGNISLYEEVEEQEKVNKSSWIHIGDNYFSDYTNALKFGINAYHYKNVFERSDIKCKADTISGSIIWAIRNNMVNNGLDIPYWQKFGVLNASPIYFGFANWLYNELKNEDNVYFLARDGYIIKKIFDKIKIKEKNDIQSYYLYTSRRAIQLPLEYYSSKKEAIDVITCVNTSLGQKFEIKNIFSYFKLNPNNYKELLKKYNFSVDDIIEKEEDILRYKQFVSEIYVDIKAEMNADIDLIKEYLKQEEITKYKRVNFVDVGWRGSVQQSLSKIIDGEVFGYYFGTSYVYDDIFYNTKGYVLNYNLPYQLSDVIYPNIPMYEFLFSSPEGSLIGFRKNSGKIEPVLKEENEYSSQISDLQDSALKIIDYYLEYYEYLKYFKPEESIRPYQEFINNKRYLDLKEFSKLRTEIGYGEKTVSFVRFVTKKQIKNDYNKFLEELNKSLWNKAFLVKDINNEDDYNDFVKTLDLDVHDKIFSFNNLKKAVKHPIKAFKKIINILGNKLKS